MSEYTRSLYEQIRAVPRALAERSWAMGLPLRPVPETVQEPRAWQTDFPEDKTDFMEAVELSDLIASSPQVPELFFEGQTIDTREETIRQEAARLGLRMLPIDNLIDENDELLEDVREEGFQGNVPYWYPDAQVMSMIAWEKSITYSDPVQRCYAVVKPDGSIGYRMEGLPEDATPEEIQSLLVKWAHMLHDMGNGPGNNLLPELAQRRQKVNSLSILFRKVKGKGLNVADITGEPQAPEDYFWTDTDPYRDSFHETDMDMHDVWVKREELSDAQIEEMLELGLPPIGRWLIYTRGRDIVRTIGRIATLNHSKMEVICESCATLNDITEVINGTPFLTTHCRMCEESILPGFVAAFSHKVAAISNMALHPIDLASSKNHIGSDHELAESQWDLGEELQDDMEDMLERQIANQSSDPWVS